MITKLVALLFVLLSTTSGWANAANPQDQVSGLCPYASASSLLENTARKASLNNVPGTGQTVLESSTSMDLTPQTSKSKY